MRKLLGERLYNALFSLVSYVTEIRLREGKRICVKSANNVITSNEIADKQTIKNIFDTATKYSKYAFEEELSKGFVYYGDGIRIGVAGDGVIVADKLKSFKNVTSLCIRVPHEIINCSKPLSDLYANFENTLIISPPACGKTTLIRDLCRELGEKYDVLIIDERLELTSESNCFRVGGRSDVVRGVPKRLCFENIIRAMSPQIVVCDELFGMEDEFAIEKLTSCGIKVLASIHAESVTSLQKSSPKLCKIFNRFVTLSSYPRVGYIKSIDRKITENGEK